MTPIWFVRRQRVNSAHFPSFLCLSMFLCHSFLPLLDVKTFWVNAVQNLLLQRNNHEDMCLAGCYVSPKAIVLCEHKGTQNAVRKRALCVIASSRPTGLLSWRGRRSKSARRNLYNRDDIWAWYRSGAWHQAASAKLPSTLTSFLLTYLLHGAESFLRS